MRGWIIRAGYGVGDISSAGPPSWAAGSSGWEKPDKLPNVCDWKYNRCGLKVFRRNDIGAGGSSQKSFSHEPAQPVIDSWPHRICDSGGAVSRRGQCGQTRQPGGESAEAVDGANVSRNINLPLGFEPNLGKPMLGALSARGAVA